MAYLREAAARLTFRRDNAPINTVEALCTFNATRSSFVAQKKLYGYLKARMGTRYPSMFEDEVFIQSINVAKVHVFAACLSDLVIHTVSKVAAAAGFETDEARALARHCHEFGLDHHHQALPEPETVNQWRDAFEARIAEVHWNNAAVDGDTFSQSPKALFKWAPIADQLKRHDREIVENSIRFAFSEVTRAFRERADLTALAKAWRNQPTGS
ncbi:hypothetical protein ACFPOD_13050 [Nitratireductor kimnyeongensis]|uniref:Uncharacterized protein n=1 Tax=Nitratireductor kimnyeongensis TaxID=430679 RepID=A0ABW0T9N8_9HYPH|nr:hypothetical protein [Nitratireductor kimnyeongensis]